MSSVVAVGAEALCPSFRVTLSLCRGDLGRGCPRDVFRWCPVRPGLVVLIDTVVMCLLQVGNAEKEIPSCLWMFASPVCLITAGRR